MAEGFLQRCIYIFLDQSNDMRRHVTTRIYRYSTIRYPVRSESNCAFSGPLMFPFAESALQCVHSVSSCFMLTAD